MMKFFAFAMLACCVNMVSCYDWKCKDSDGGDDDVIFGSIEMPSNDLVTSKV